LQLTGWEQASQVRLRQQQQQQQQHGLDAGHCGYTHAVWWRLLCVSGVPHALFVCAPCCKRRNATDVQNVALS
jgi:hypothetical protein